MKAKQIIAGVAAGLAAITLSVGLNAHVQGMVDAAYERGVGHGQEVVTDDAFDRGMKAGSEYERWFCKTGDMDVTS